MKRRKCAILFLIVLIVSLGNVGGEKIALAAPEQSEGFTMLSDILTIFPDEQFQKAKEKGYHVKFGIYPPSRYELETSFEDPSFWEVKNQIANGGYFLLDIINNLLWSILMKWDFIVIMLTESAFSLNVVDGFADAVEKAVQQFSGFNGSSYDNSGIVGNFLTFMIILAGAWIAYKGLVQKRTAQAMSGMITSLLILILGLAFFANAGGVMRYLNEISAGLSQEVMGVGLVFQKELKGGKGEDYPADVAPMVIADKLYHMFIYEPYLMLQYGKTSKDPDLTKDRIYKILGSKVGSSAREKAVLEEKNGIKESGFEPNPMVTPAGTLDRLSLLLMLSISHLILGLLFVIIAGSMLVYQFMFIFVALFAPFAFLLSLHPAWSAIANTWFKKFIGYQLIKLIIGLLFSMLLTLSQFIYEMNSPEKVGYVWTIAMQLILVVGVVWKRNELFSILQAPLRKEERLQGSVSIQMPLSYVSKYTESLTRRVQSLRVRK